MDYHYYLQSISGKRSGLTSLCGIAVSSSECGLEGCGPNPINIMWDFGPWPAPVFEGVTSVDDL